MSIINALIVRWGGNNARGGQVEVVDTTSEGTYGRREGFISAGDVADIATITKIAAGNLAITKDPVKSLTARMVDVDPAEGHSVYTNYGVADTLTAPDYPSGTFAARCVAVTVEQDGDYLNVTPEFVSLRDVLSQRLSRWLTRTSNGLLAGVSSSASIVSVSSPSIVTSVETVNAVTFNTGGGTSGLGDKSSPDKSPVGRCLFYRVELAGTAAGLTATTYKFTVNGVIVCSVSLAGSSVTTVYDLTATETALVAPGDLWLAECTLAGGHVGVGIRCLVTSIEPS